MSNPCLGSSGCLTCQARARERGARRGRVGDSQQGAVLRVREDRLSARHHGPEGHAEEAEEDEERGEEERRSVLKILSSAQTCPSGGGVTHRCAFSLPEKAGSGLPGDQRP